MSESGHSSYPPYDPYSQPTAQEVYRSQPPRDADATQPIRVLPPPPPRNRLGAITFVVVVLAALLAVFPATAALGLLLCLLAIVPAIFAFRRIRKGTATNRRRSLATLVLAPVFFIVATCVVAATAPRPTITNAEATTPIQGLAAAPALQQSPTSTLVPALGPNVSQAPAAPPAPVSFPAPATPASPPLVHAAAPTAGPKPQSKPRMQPAPKPEAQPKPEAKPKPSSGSGSRPVVTSGAFCSPAGAVGVTSKGTPMSCKLDSKGERLRWSKA